MLVDSGVVLTITDPGTVIHMPRNAHITLEPGARLIVQDSARITNSCEDCFWWGIVAKGTTGQAQQPFTNPLHATVVMNNGAVIEHARKAITLFDMFGGDTTKGGGIAIVNNSSFINNASSLFMAYYPGFDNKTRFTNCTFSIDNDYKGHDIDYRFGAHAVLVGVTGVDFKGCSFLNNDTFTQNKGRGMGILAADAGFSVLPICTGGTNPCTYQYSNFEGFRNGINVAGSYDNPTTAYITHANFDRNTIGVRVLQENDVTVVNSNFDIGRGLASNLYGEEGSWGMYMPSCALNVGIYSNGSTRFTVEENTFTGHSSPGIGKLGTFTVSSGVNNNTIYRNDFDSLTEGSVSAWVNGAEGGWLIPDSLKGLKYKCNAYTNNGVDIHVAAYPNATIGQSTPSGIAPYQASGFFGTTYQSVENAFSATANNIINEGHGIGYYCSSTANSCPGTTSGFVGVVNTTPSGCLSNFNTDAEWETDMTTFELGLSAMKARWDSVNIEKNTQLGNYYGQIDNGNTASLLSYIAGLTPSPGNAASLNTMLTGYSPYLSAEVVQASFSIITNNTTRANLVLANPDLLRNEPYYYYLTHSVSPPFSNPTVTSFTNARSTVSTRGEDEINISVLTNEMSDIAKRVIFIAKRDTTGASIDSLPTWYRKYNTLDAYYSLVGHYFSIGDDATAQTILDSIPIRFTLSGDDQAYFNGYDSIFQVAKGIIADGRKMTNPLQAEIDKVNGFITGGTHQVGIFGQKVFGMQVVLEPPVTNIFVNCLEDGWIWERKAHPVTEQPVPELANINDKNNYLMVAPNPAKDNVVFTYDVPNANGKLIITVSSAIGQQVKQLDVTGNMGSINWETSMVPAGTYIYKLTDSRGAISTGKLVIVK